MSSSRLIHSYGGSQTLTDYLLSLFLIEMIQPSAELYVTAPFLSNAPFLKNYEQQYEAMFPFAKGNTIYFTDILEMIAWKGTSIRIICDPQREETKSVLAALQGKAEFRFLENNHDKGIVSENFYLHGSMNFTYRGLYVNHESVRVTDDASEVRKAMLIARHRWQEAIEL